MTVIMLLCNYSEKLYGQTNVKTVGKCLEINGKFNSELKDGLPEGWIPNKPGYWDEEGTISLKKITGTKINALQVTTKTKAVRLYYNQHWPIVKGDKCVVRAIVKGKGGVDLGVYYHQASRSLIKGFAVTEEWSEYKAEITVPEANPEISEIVVVIGASPGATVEFAEVTATIIKEGLSGSLSDGDSLSFTEPVLSENERLWKIANVREYFLIDRQMDDNIRQFLALKQQAKKMIRNNETANGSVLIRKYDDMIAGIRVPTKRLVAGIDRHDVTALLYVNGEEVTLSSSGKYAVSINEGLNIIGMKVMVNGKSPGLRLRIPGQPELESRWRVGSATDDTWLSPAFDDQSWRKAEFDKDGYLIVPKSFDGAVCFRQIILWGDHHYSGLPCIQPKVREWGFSVKSLETLFLALYSPSPLPFALEDYEFVLDLPKGFHLLKEKYTDDAKGRNFNRRPKKVTEEAIHHENQPYTRYRLTFEPEFVPARGTGGESNQASLIPVLLDKSKGAGALCRFYFRRLASGNLTELEQTLPVRILPPLNGRMPKKVMLAQYCSEPWAYSYIRSNLFPEHFESHMRQSLDVGFNSWFLHNIAGDYVKKVYDRVIERGGIVVLAGANYPIRYPFVTAETALGKLTLTVPEFRLKYFNQPERGTKVGEYCRSYVTGEGLARFREAVKKDITRKIFGSDKVAGFPKASIYWVDWEEKIWKGSGKGSYCFCDNCKKSFREFAKLSDTTDLSDSAILKNHKDGWKAFREELDGRINGVVHEVCNELGVKYMFYDDAFNDGHWLASRGKMDIAYPGWPGDGTAVGYGSGNSTRNFPVKQESLDERMAFFREKMGQSRIHGQLFATVFDMGWVKPGTSWTQRSGSTVDGFINAKGVKSQILRVIASFHAGVDLGSSLNRCAGQLYYIGEATRIITAFENLFYEGKREDNLAVSEQLKYPNLLVLRKGDERLVLLFNETDKPITVRLNNKDLKKGQEALVFESSEKISNPGWMNVVVGAGDVTVVHIR
ncbi:MAG: hypothetical protein M0Q53_09320 [Prolixibacteraceae bacterium]|nr:hypothetical protein [Prolixibacteraceae bacterium]